MSTREQTKLDQLRKKQDETFRIQDARYKTLVAIRNALKQEEKKRKSTHDEIKKLEKKAHEHEHYPSRKRAQKDIKPYRVKLAGIDTRIKKLHKELSDAQRAFDQAKEAHSITRTTYLIYKNSLSNSPDQK